MWVSESPDQTIEIGFRIGSSLSAGTILCLEGDLGAGKTTFMKGVVSGVTGNSRHEVTSPTFIYLQIYEGTLTLYHFDLYRIATPSHFLEMGFGEFLHTEGVCCLEWSDRIRPLLPSCVKKVRLVQRGESSREIHYE